MNWFRKLGRQLMMLVAIMLAATMLTFAITEILPGDAAVDILGETATQEVLASLRTELGLDRSLPVQCADWLGKVVVGDLGKLYRTRESISASDREDPHALGSAGASTTALAGPWPGEASGLTLHNRDSSGDPVTRAAGVGRV